MRRIAKPASRLTLAFDPDRLQVGDGTDLRTGLSAAAMTDQYLFVACDEGCRLERLTLEPRRARADRHETFELDRLLKLPGKPDAEADIEGMDVDDGWLWLVGSHSVKRRKADRSTPPSIVERLLADTRRDGNRHLLARIPLRAGTPEKRRDGRRAGTLAATTTSSELLDAIIDHDDVHLAPFVDIPGKDNGFDIEGLAVRDGRAFVGLRSPVLREWCCVLTLEIHADSRGALHLARGRRSPPYGKHFLRLGGLGVRDLVWWRDDLLILAGPPLAHDGPSELWRWSNVAASTKRGEAAAVRRLVTIPPSDGCDRAEAIVLLDSGARPSLLVVYDSPSSARLEGPASVHADIIRLP
ncbi:MAG: DUF3616 domain-containing protein [Vicinamibacterales bacterium]